MHDNDDHYIFMCFIVHLDAEDILFGDKMKSSSQKLRKIW